MKILKIAVLLIALYALALTAQAKRLEHYCLRVDATIIVTYDFQPYCMHFEVGTQMIEKLTPGVMEKIEQLDAPVSNGTS